MHCVIYTAALLTLTYAQNTHSMLYRQTAFASKCQSLKRQSVKTLYTCTHAMRYFIYIYFVCYQYRYIPLNIYIYAHICINALARIE